MEIRCSHCQHVGPAASVRPDGTRLLLSCEACGEANTLELDGAASSAPAPEPEASLATPLRGPIVVEEEEETPKAPEVIAPAVIPPSGETNPLLMPRALERLVPEYGDGLRCRKCAHLLRADEDHCPRCGLGVEDSFKFAPGQAPWERAPQGSEQAYERAELLWQAATRDWTEENAKKYADFCRDEGFHESAIRNLRFFLIDHPDDPIALEHLQELAVRMQSRLIVARAQAEMSAKQFSTGLQRTRRVLLWAVVLLWSVIFIVFLVRFVDNC